MQRAPFRPFSLHRLVLRSDAKRRVTKDRAEGSLAAGGQVSARHDRPGRVC